MWCSRVRGHFYGLLVLISIALFSMDSKAMISEVATSTMRWNGCVAFVTAPLVNKNPLSLHSCPISWPLASNFICSIRRTRQQVACFASRASKKRRVSGRIRKESADNERNDEGGIHRDQQDAPRVSSQINIPVRRQIAFVKQMKKIVKEEERPNTAVTKKARKKKDLGQREAIASDYASFKPSLCTTYLLVDGYNVINNWTKMIKARSVAGMPSARQALLEQLRYIHHSRRWKVVVAYDEHTPGSELRIMEGDVDEVFTGERESADSYIERRAVELCKSGDILRVKVATDDRTIQVVSLASGAETMSTSSLIREIYLARRELLFQRDGTDWRTKKSFDDAQEYFVD